MPDVRRDVAGALMWAARRLVKLSLRMFDPWADNPPNEWRRVR